MMTMMSEPVDFGNKLSRNVRITKSARYYASTFYAVKGQYSNASIGFLSSYVIIVNLLPMLNVGVASADAISFFSISVSILILVFSQLESSKEYKLLSSRLLNCGKELRTLETEIDGVMLLRPMSDESDKEERLVDLSTKYDTILKKYQENHNSASYHKAKLSCEEGQFNVLQQVIIETRYLLSPRIQYLVLIVAPPMAFGYWLVTVK